MNKFPLLVILGIFLAAPALAQSGDDAVAVETMQALKAQEETATAKQLEKLLEAYDLSRWTFTRRVRIEHGVIPHSHPVLTLSAREASDDNLLATYVHEQIHWYLAGQADAMDAIRAALAERYGELPVGYPDGARDADSNYRHLVVNTLEYRALEELIGRERADAVFGGYRHYRRLYDIVQNEIEEIEAVMAAHGLARP